MNAATRRAVPCFSMLAGALALSACMVGPDYRRPDVATPDSFKEGTDWQRASANPGGAIDSQWWLAFGDPVLNDLVDRSLRANQSIATAEAAYRVALAEVAQARAGLFPTVSASASATRSRGTSSAANGPSAGTGATATTIKPASANAPSTSNTAITNSLEVGLQASWEPDLWGAVRRNIEANADLAQASDAQLAGERISIAALVATDYFLLRQADSDLEVYQRQAAIEQQFVMMTQDALSHGTASHDQLLNAENARDGIVANLNYESALRASYEHALAVLVGVAPAQFSVVVDAQYVFPTASVPLTIPSVVLQRRPDVVNAERSAASANARIGVAQAAYFPVLDLTANAGLAADTLSRLLSAPTRVWSLGPALSETIFDGGARSAAVDIARANYDEQVAIYRLTVLSAFQNVEDSLSSVSALRAQSDALQAIYARTEQLYQSIIAQQKAGTASPQDVLNVELALETARQNWEDSRSQVAQATVGLVRNLGGGWDGSSAPIEGATSQR